MYDQLTRSDVTEDNGEYSGAFGGRVPHLCLPEDAGVDLDNPPHPLFCQQGDVLSFLVMIIVCMMDYSFPYVYSV